MPNIENLKYKDGERHKLTEDELKKGGLNSAKARKEQKIFKQAIAERMGYDDFNEMVDNLIKRAKGNDKSFEVLRDTMGQTITNTIQVVETPIINDDI